MPKKNSNTSLSTQKPVALWNKSINLNFKDFIHGLGKMAVSGVMLDGKGVADGAIDLLKEAGLKDEPEQLAWVLIYKSLIRTLTDLVYEYRGIFNQDVEENQLAALAQTFEQKLNEIPVHIDIQFFERPQDLPLLDAIKPAFIGWLKELGVTEHDASSIHARLKSKFILSLHQEWLARSSDYLIIKEQIDTPFIKANLIQQSWQQYYAWLHEQINERMFDEVFGLKQVYVPLRAYYNVKAPDDRDDQIVFERENSQKLLS